MSIIKKAQKETGFRENSFMLLFTACTIISTSDTFGVLIRMFMDQYNGVSLEEIKKELLNKFRLGHSLICLQSL